MALGGGNYLTQNKNLPGSYINFVSKARASTNLSERGYAVMGLDLSWGPESEMMIVTSEDFQKNAYDIFGYEYTHEKLKGLRDLFLNLSVLYAYRLNREGVKASCDFGMAKYPGVRGNDIAIVIQDDVDDTSKKEVITLVDGKKVDEQSVRDASELTDNGFVVFKTDAELENTAATPLTGGIDGTVTGLSHQKFLDAAESYSFNVIGTTTEDNAVKALYASYAKRMRDETGVKFQVVVHNYAADYEGVINVKNTVEEGCDTSLVYWVTGASAACAVNKSNLNKIYDGEFSIKADYTQSQLENALLTGEYVFHKTGGEIRVLSDINSLVTVSDEKGNIFKENQTVRVTDQIANDIAHIFNTRYLGTVPNDESGRISLWADIVKHHEQLQHIRAIEGFSENDVKVYQGDTKNAVVVTDAVTIINAMAKLYMEVTIL